MHQPLGYLDCHFSSRWARLEQVVARFRPFEAGPRTSPESGGRRAEPCDLHFSVATLAGANQEHLDLHCSRLCNVNVGGTLAKP
jgi:hypothetical protein